MPANRITTSSASRRRLARPSFLSMIGGAERIEVESAVIGDHPQVIIAPPDHPLAMQRSISPRPIKQAVMAGLGIALISAHTIAAEIGDGRLAILDVAGLPEIRQWFVVHLATKRMMPAASSLRDFLVAEGRRFLPNVAGEMAKRLRREAITLPRGSDDNFRFSGEGLAGHPCSRRVLCGLLLTLEKRKVTLGIH
jgi:DNA-binding transcriptional LysR family regulator